MNKITIKMFRDCRQSDFGAYRYMHLIQLKSDGHAYTVYATQEYIRNMIELFKLAGKTVKYTEEPCITVTIDGGTWKYQP